MKTKILIFIAFCMFFVGIYLAYFKDQNNYKQERQKDLIYLMKQKNEIQYQQLEDEHRGRTKEELSYSDTYGKSGRVHPWEKINNLTKKFMNENQQDFSFDTLKVYVEKANNIFTNHNIYKSISVEDNFSLPEIPTKAFEKYSLFEKKLWYELIRMQIYDCEKLVCKRFTVAFCWSRDYSYHRF